jgi:uncharacterized protein with HEPN domain
MQHDPRAWLWDVRQAADSIAAFVHGRDFVDYEADLMLRSAVERQFEIAGEALNRLSREAPEIAARLPELRYAIAMRNALIHGYREVDNATVWQTVHDDLPGLRARVATLLAELGDDL